MRQRKIAVALGVLLLSPAAAQATTAAAVQFKTVALTGDPAHGAGAGLTYLDFQYASIGDNGHVAYEATLAGDGVTIANREAIWAGSPDAPTLVARTQGTPPDGNATYGQFYHPPTLNGSGQIVYRADLFGPSGVYAGAYDAPQYVLRSGQQAPGVAAGVKHAYLPRSASINDSGTLAFIGSLSGPGISTNTNDWALWMGTPGTLQLVARGGNVAPNTPTPANLGVFGLASPINEDSRIAFSATLNGPGLEYTNSRALYVAGSGDMTFIAATASPAAGIPNATYAAMLPPVRGDAGDVAFVSSVSGVGITDANDTAIFHGQPAALSVLAREGAQAPGTPAGVKFHDFRTTLVAPQIDGLSKIAFKAMLSGTGIADANRTGIWAGDSLETLKLLARASDQVAGLPAGVRWAGFNSDPVISELGQVAFLANLIGTGIGPTNSQSLWVTMPDGSLRLVVRAGETIEVEPGDFRIVSNITTTMGLSGEVGFPTFISAEGKMALDLSFTNGSSGIFIASVPEPAALGLIALPLAMALRRRR